MNTKARAYCSFIILVAIAILPFQTWTALAELPRPHIEGLIALIAIGVLSEFLSVIASVGRHQASTSIAFIPFFAAAMLFPSPAALVAVVATSILTQGFVHKRPAFRAAFNASQATLSIFVATWVYTGLGGHSSTPLDIASFRTLPGLISLGGLAVSFFLVNQTLVSIAIAFLNEERVKPVIYRVVAAGGGSIVYDVLASPVAVVVALLYSNFSTGGLIMGILPLLIIRHTYWSNAKLQQANKDLLSVLVKTIETRDPYTSGHSIRVSILARAIAEDMDLSATQVDRIETAALVHDIGKIDAIYASLIRKEGPLTDAERHVIVTHAAKGAEFLKTLTLFSSDMIDGVRHHHERYDGSGYPDGLTAEQIPLPARIIQLCDSIDAMLSDRPYRKALTIEHVRGELLRCAGTQFDPKIVDIILKRNTLERAAALVRPDRAIKPQLVIATA